VFSEALKRVIESTGIDYVALSRQRAEGQDNLNEYLDMLTPEGSPPAYSVVGCAAAQPWRADDNLGLDKPKLRLLSLGMQDSSWNSR